MDMDRHEARVLAKGPRTHSRTTPKVVRPLFPAGFLGIPTFCFILGIEFYSISTFSRRNVGC